MNTVVKIIKIEAFQKEGISLLYGKGPAINGTSITFEVIEGAGMFYAGQNEAAITPGNSYSFWWPLEAAASLYVLQQVANTINYQSVKKTSIWNATSNYGRGSTEEFDNEQDAKEFARNCAPCIQRIDSYTDVICIDTDNIINLTQHTAIEDNKMKVSQIIERIIYNNRRFEVMFSESEIESAVAGAEIALQIAGMELEHDIDYSTYEYQDETGWYAYYLECVDKSRTESS